MELNTIVITGYPKSGNTWLTRLVGEVTQFPVVGFWNEPDNPEIAIEGLDRENGGEVYKSHHTVSEIFKHECFIPGSTKVICIIRNPYSF